MAWGFYFLWKSLGISFFLQARLFSGSVSNSRLGVGMILRWQLFIGLVFFSVFFASRTTRKMPVLATAMLAYVLISALFISHWPFYSQDFVNLRLRLVSARSYGLIIALVFFVSQMSLQTVWKFLLAFRWVAVIDAVVTLASLFLFTNGAGFFNAGSMDTAFIAFSLPLFFLTAKRTRWDWAGLSLCLIAISFTQGSTAYLVLLAVVAAYFVARGQWVLVLGSAAAVSGVAVFTQKAQVLNDNGRIGPWRTIMQWWWEGPPKGWETMQTMLPDNWDALMRWRLAHSPIAFGTGTGTFQWIGPTVQNNPENVFVWMHNEYLQVLFEQGVLGLGMMLILVGYCVRRSYKSPALFACVAGVGASFLTQFPLRYFLGQVFVALLLRVVLEKETA